MAGSCVRGRMVAVLCIAALLSSSVMVRATQYTVGGSSGWNSGVDYSAWSSQYSFKTGDSLEFSYGELHSVLQVSEEDYKACSTANALTTGTGGSTVVKLEKEQTYYFICGTPGHCANGMQLSVTVGGASSTPSDTTTPSTTTSPSIAQPSIATYMVSSQGLLVLTTLLSSLSVCFQGLRN